jgi:1-acyl-sn-glycerol-3-phosphate acyltransferase
LLEMNDRTERVTRIRRLISLVRVGVVALWTILWTALALTIHLLTRNHDIPLAIADRLWAPSTLRMMGARLEVRGVDELDFERSYLFVANHTSQLDIPVLFAALPIPLRFLAKEELRKVPLVGRFISAMGMVYVARGQSEASRQSIDRLASSLAEGMCLMAFPEGTRSHDGALGEFKTGAFVAAIKSGVPVVPIYISGAAQILPAGTLVTHSGRVTVVAGEPIPTQPFTLDDRRRLADLVRSKMVELGAQRGADYRVASSRT